MKIVVYKNGKQEKIDPKTLTINGTSLDQVLARVAQLEKEVSKMKKREEDNLKKVQSFTRRRY